MCIRDRVDSVALNGKRNMDVLSKGISPTLNTVAYLNSALVDSFLSLIDLIKKDDLVVKPIAVYFE